MDERDKIIAEIAADTIWYYNQNIDERCCVFCDIILFPDESHKEDCLWIRAKVANSLNKEES
jgi:hypothetical protein